MKWIFCKVWQKLRMIDWPSVSSLPNSRLFRLRCCWDSLPEKYNIFEIMKFRIFWTRLWRPINDIIGVFGQFSTWSDWWSTSSAPDNIYFSDKLQLELSQIFWTFRTFLRYLGNSHQMGIKGNSCWGLWQRRWWQWQKWLIVDNKLCWSWISF